MYKFAATLLALLLSMVLFCEVVFAGQVTVFIYHRFDENRYPSTNISSEIFEQQLIYLKNEGYQVLSLGEIVRRMREGEPFPEKGVALCADDAYSSFAKVAMPILRKYDYPMTLFVNTDAVGARGYLDWETVTALAAEGVEIGNHTASHPYLVEKEAEESFAAWRQRITSDIIKAQKQFKKYLNFEPTLFAYTYGEYSNEVVSAVQELGFASAFAQQSGVIDEHHDLYRLPRFPMGGPYATLQGFVDKLQMKPFVVLQEEPISPVLSNSNPPELLLQVDATSVDMRRVNCFVQGENSCRVEKVAERAGWYRVVAEEPLSGRRNKYTLTAPSKKGGWHWYSHPWLNADSPALAEVTDKLSAPLPKTHIGKTGETVSADQ